MKLNTNSKISIITPSYNQSIFIENAIKSILNQNYINFEHIVIDNCSTDNTIQILKKYPHIIWYSEPDKGQSDAINKGFKLATGDIVAWLNADDYYYQNTFNQINNAFKKNHEVDLIYGDCDFVDAQNKLIRHKKEIPFDYKILLYYGCYIPSTSTFIRRKVIENDELLNIDFHYTMDYEYWVRLAVKGYKFHYVPEIWAAFRWHEGNKSHDYIKRYQERIKVQDTYGIKFLKNKKYKYFIYKNLYYLYKIKHIYKKILNNSYL